MTIAINLTQRRWLLLFPLFALVILMLLVLSKSAPSQSKAQYRPPLVKTAQVRIKNLAASVQGFGRAQPKQTWQAIAEVSGKVIYRHKQLEAGAILFKGTRVLAIDPVDLQLKLTQSKAEHQTALAKAKQIAINQQRLTLAVALERNKLVIAKQELKRKENLFQQGSVAKSLVETERLRCLAQQQALLLLENNLKLIPNELAIAQATIEATQARVDEAKRNLAKTEITLPFDARINQVNAELHQVVSPPAILLSANHLDIMEVHGQFPFSPLKNLLHHSETPSSSFGGKFPDIDHLGLTAIVKAYQDDKVLSWPAKVTQISEKLDRQTNTLGLTLEVTNNWRNLEPVSQPKLVDGMFLEITVFAPKRAVLTIPSQAIHGNQVYLLKENKLVKQSVTVLFDQGDYAIIDSASNNLSSGDPLILTDLVPAIDGMSIRTSSPNKPSYANGKESR